MRQSLALCCAILFIGCNSEKPPAVDRLSQKEIQEEAEKNAKRAKVEAEQKAEQAKLEQQTKAAEDAVIAKGYYALTNGFVLEHLQFAKKQYEKANFPAEQRKYVSDMKRHIKEGPPRFFSGGTFHSNRSRPATASEG